MKKIMLFVALIVFSAFSGIAQDAIEKAKDNWFNLDAVQDNTKGVSTEKAYLELLKDKKSKKSKNQQSPGQTGQTKSQRHCKSCWHPRAP